MAEPPVPQSLVALRDTRERAIAALSDAFANDVIELDEFERRLTLAHRAQSVAELEPLTSDLGTPAPAAAAKPSTALARVPSTAPLVRGETPARRRILAVFGGGRRSGQWRVPQRLRIVAVFGGIELDFRHAVFPDGVAEVDITACMGGVNIVVPPNLAVEMDGNAILGGFEHSERVSAVPDPDRPVLRVTGLAVMGGVNIETRLPGEETQEEHWRRRHQLKHQLREQRKLAKAERRLRRAERALGPHHED